MTPKSVPMLNRRALLASAGFAVLGLSAARAADLSQIKTSAIRGSIDAGDFGIRPGAFDDQSRAFIRMLASASERDIGVFLPPGTYLVSNVMLPPRVRLTGIPGATRIVYGGEGHLFLGEAMQQLDLSGLVLDGANRRLGEDVQGLLDIRSCDRVAVDGCEIIGSARNGIAFERVGGRIERSLVTGAGSSGIHVIDSQGLAIAGNTVTDCADGGILVHRWQPGEDGTMVQNNRVERIGARSGGTGQNGNGINVFRASGVLVTGNRVADCAFSAIRANSASNLQITSNQAVRSGETAIYAEFAFEGAVIGSNLVDGAANGISIVNFNEGGRLAVCSGNLARNLSLTGPYPADAPGFGVGITVEADASVTGNVIEAAPLYGLAIGWGAYMRNVVASANVIRASPVGIAVSVVEGTGSAILTDNVIDGASSGAIVGHRWAKPATGDLALQGAKGLSGLTVERNRVS